MYFRDYRLSKTLLDQSLKSAVNGCQTLVKSALEHFDHVFWSLWGEMICNTSPLFKFEILGCLLTHWLQVASILFLVVRICSSLFKCNYLENKKLFLHFVFHLWSLHQIFNIFEKKMIVIAKVFPKLQTVKDLVKPLSRKHRFRISFYIQRINGCQTLGKSAWEHFDYVFRSLWGGMIRKISSLFKFEILGVFLNTLTFDEEYPLWDCENLQFHIQMQLC